MNNQSFSKIWIIVIFVIFIAGGILAWQYSKPSYKEVSETSFISNIFNSNSLDWLFSFFQRKKVLCTDTDNGLNYDIAGIVTYQIGKNPIIYSDKCLAPSRWSKYNLLEYYCRNNWVHSQKYICPEGCREGACIKKIICQNECSPAGLKRCSDNGYQICGNYDIDDCLEWGVTTNCPSNTICQNGSCIQQKCTDGTLYGQCAINKPKYCENGNLVDKCSECGCPSEQKCLSDGSCKIVSEKCVDNDYYCPWECNNWKLDNDCGVPQIYDFVESRNPSDYLNSNIVHWDDADWKNYQPLINKVNEITSGINNDFEKAKAIANWVRNSKLYGEPSPANEGKSVIEIFNSNTGVCMDAAILTAAMFRIAGIPFRTVLPAGFHEYTEGYINGRWIGFDATFGGGEAVIIDPVTSILYNNEFYQHEPKFVTIFSDGRTYDITDVSYYKVNIIERDIFKSGEADIKITWSLNTQEPIKEKYCTLSSFKTSQEERYNLSPIEKTLSLSDPKYSLNCVVILQSDPYTEHNELIAITFTGERIQKESLISSGYVKINIETIGIRNILLGWGTIYIPNTSMILFKNQDNSYSLVYDKDNYSDFTSIKWGIKSNNLNCDYYSCEYTKNNNYSQTIQSVGILGYGNLNISGQISRGMPPDHYNGFVKIKLPEGEYKLIYSIPFYGNIAYKLFQIAPNQKIVIYPDELSKESTANIDLFNLVQSALLSSIEGLNP